MNRALFGIIILIVAMTAGIMALQTSKAPKQATNPPTEFQNTSPTPVSTSDIIKSTTPGPSSTPTPTPFLATRATISTSKGDIVLALYPKDAPKTVANFTVKAQSGFYNGLDFHRVEDWVIQGGDPLGNGTGGNDTLPAEYNNKPFVVGSLGVARKQDPTWNNDSQFFITKAEVSSLNGQYTNFGIVTAGMDVANKIQVGDKILKITVE